MILLLENWNTLRELKRSKASFFVCMELLDDYNFVNEKETEFGIKQISCQDILFCVLRILFGIFITYQCNLWLPFILLCLLCVCKAITFVVITQSSRILSKYVDDYSKHEIGIKTIDSLNKKTAFILS